MACLGYVVQAVVSKQKAAELDHHGHDMTQSSGALAHRVFAQLLHRLLDALAAA